MVLDLMTGVSHQCCDTILPPHPPSTPTAHHHIPPEHRIKGKIMNKPISRAPCDSELQEQSALGYRQLCLNSACAIYPCLARELCWR